MSQRDRLMGRLRPALPYPILIDPDAAEVARRELDQAKAAQRHALIAGHSDDNRALVDERVADADTRLSACYETIKLRALATDGDVTVERLIAAHPPTAAQMAAAKTARDKARQAGEDLPAWPAWNDATFRPALLAACAESDMTVEDWAAFLASHVSDGEARGIWRAVLAVNSLERVADPLVLPKGWTQTLS